MKIEYHPDFWKSVRRCFGWRGRIRQRFYNLKRRFQRFRRKYADDDIWNLAFFLCEILPPMLKSLRENHCGYPPGLSSKKWEDILRKMEVGFLACNALEEKNYMDKFRDGEESDYDWDGIHKHEAMLEKKFDVGMNLFKKYFFSLWD